MRRHDLLRWLTAISIVIAAACCTARAQAGRDDPPEVVPGRSNIVLVLTPQMVAGRMLELAKTSRDDRVINIGDGNGRAVNAAANVEGFWGVRIWMDTEPDDTEILIVLQQMSAILSGQVVIFRSAFPLTGTLNGNEIAFRSEIEGYKVEFKGEVKGDVMEGSVAFHDRNGRWSATRLKHPRYGPLLFRSHGRRHDSSIHPRGATGGFREAPKTGVPPKNLWMTAPRALMQPTAAG